MSHRTNIILYSCIYYYISRNITAHIQQKCSTKEQNKSVTRETFVLCSFFMLYSFKNILYLTCIFPGNPVESILLATLTVLPHISY